MPVLDTFSGGDANPIGGLWSHNSSLESTPAQVLSGKLTGSTTDFWDAIYAADFGPSGENYVTISTRDTSSIILRVKTNNIGPTANSYLVFITNDGVGSGLYVGTGGVATQLGASFDVTLGSGDKLGIEYMSGSGDLNFYTKIGAGAWTQIATRNNTDHQNETGKSTIESGGNVQAFDDFGSGPPAPLVGLNSLGTMFW